MRAQTEEDSSQCEIVLVAPKLPQTSEENTFGPFSIDHVQNAMEVAIACNQRADFEIQLKQTSSRQEDAFCGCFEARDASGNVERKLNCFLRARLRGQINAPTDGSTLMREHLVDGLHIKGGVKSGAALSTCYWSIYRSESTMVADALVLEDEGKISGEQCQIDQHVDTSSLANGSYILILSAEDNAHRRLGSGVSVIFQIRRDMVRLPGRIVRPKL